MTDAEQHVTRHQQIDGQVWDWQDAPGVPEPTSCRDLSNYDARRFEWPDGSAIVELYGGWDFGFSRAEVDAGERAFVWRSEGR